MSNYFIAIFIVLLAYNILDFFVHRHIAGLNENLANFIQLSIYAAPAVLFFHIKTALYSDYKFVKNDLLHLIPVLLVYIVTIPITYSESIPEEAQTGISIAYYTYLYLLLFVYLFISYRELKRHRGVFLENYSSSDLKRYRYIENLILIVLVMFVLSAINIFTRFFYQLEEFSFISYVVISVVLILFSWLTFNGLKSPELFIDNRFAQPPVYKTAKSNDGKTSLILSEDLKLQVKVLEDYMRTEEPFLDASLTLHDLANMAGIPARELSLLINHHLNKHFFDFVNEYRIEKAKELLRNPERKDYTVLEILYEVGFNSKSSFNTAFKKLSGLTPTEYRRRNT